jgi:hypothetical protein
MTRSIGFLMTIRNSPLNPNRFDQKALKCHGGNNFYFCCFNLFFYLKILYLLKTNVADLVSYTTDEKFNILAQQIDMVERKMNKEDHPDNVGPLLLFTSSAMFFLPAFFALS